MNAFAARRDRERTQLREKILAATRTLLVEGGVVAVTMREVARRVEYSPGILYQHFADKDALIHALCQADFADFAALFLSLSSNGGPLVHLCRAGLAYLEFARQFPEHYRFMFMTSVGPAASPDNEEQRQDATQNAYVFLCNLVEQAIQQGLVREEIDDAHLASQTIWAAIHGTAALEVCRPERADWVCFRAFEHRANAAVRMAIETIAKSPEQANAALRVALEESNRG